MDPWGQNQAREKNWNILLEEKHVSMFSWGQGKIAQILGDGERWKRDFTRVVIEFYLKVST